MPILHNVAVIAPWIIMNLCLPQYSQVLDINWSIDYICIMWISFVRTAEYGWIQYQCHRCVVFVAFRLSWELPVLKNRLDCDFRQCFWYRLALVPEFSATENFLLLPPVTNFPIFKFSNLIGMRPLHRKYILWMGSLAAVTVQHG